MRPLLVCCLVCLAAAAAAQDSTPLPAVTGYVTRVVSASDFDVNGWRIVCGAGTKTTMLGRNDSGPRIYQAGCPQDAPRLGLPVTVWGTRDKRRQAVMASQMDLGPVALESLSSYGIIEEIVARTPHSLTVRADGYTIRILSSAHLKFKAPLRTLAEVTANVWLDYKGKQQADGTVLADEARFTPNWPNPRAATTRARTNYDPSQVTKKGNPVVESVIGVNAMKIPAWADAGMQARVAAVGEKLIPSYERHLAADDPTKINFRFYVTAGDPRLPGVLALPSGILLVPHAIVDRMQNDSQLAAVLAESMAVEMEAQDDRMLQGVRPTRKEFEKRTAEAAAFDAGGAVLPVPLALGLSGGSFVGIAEGARKLRAEVQQSARVSLTLMRDAGYDIGEAPVAWWRLSGAEGKPLAETPMPEESVNLYRDLSATWGAALPAAAASESSR